MGKDDVHRDVLGRYDVLQLEHEGKILTILLCRNHVRAPNVW